jgi:hypothetical protein
MSLSVEDILTYVKDKSEYNILLQGEPQSSTELVTLCMRMAVDTFNSVTPKTSFSIDDFPNSAILLYGTLHHIAIGEAERQLRNQVEFTTQGLNVAFDNKYGMYRDLATYYRGLFDSETRPFKAYLNSEEAWGESYSPYSRINDFLFRG